MATSSRGRGSIPSRARGAPSRGRGAASSRSRGVGKNSPAQPTSQSSHKPAAPSARRAPASTTTARQTNVQEEEETRDRSPSPRPRQRRRLNRRQVPAERPFDKLRLALRLYDTTTSQGKRQKLQSLEDASPEEQAISDLKHIDRDPTALKVFEYAGHRLARAGSPFAPVQLVLRHGFIKLGLISPGNVPDPVDNDDEELLDPAHDPPDCLDDIDPVPSSSDDSTPPAENADNPPDNPEAEQTPEAEKEEEIVIKCIKETDLEELDFLFEMLYVDIPDAEAMFTELSDNIADLMLIARPIKYYMFTARSDDLKKLRPNALRICQDDPDVNEIPNPQPTKYLTRGWEHVWTARKICARYRLIDFDKNPQKFMNDVKSGKEVVQADNMANCFYPPDIDWDPEQPEEGLFRSEYFIRTCRHLLDGNGFKDAEAKRTTKKPIGEKYNLRKFTGRLVAYSATLLRFSLSAVPEWRRQHSSEPRFHYPSLFYGIAFQFEHDPEDEWARGLLEHLDKAVFTERDDGKVSSEILMQEPDADSDMAIMARNMARRRREREVKEAEEEAAKAAAQSDDTTPSSEQQPMSDGS